jgi:hypothetical protein
MYAWFILYEMYTNLKNIDVLKTKYACGFLPGFPKPSWALPDVFLWRSLVAVLDQRVARAAQRINVGKARRGAGIGSFALADSPVPSIFGPIQIRHNFKRDDQVKSNKTKNNGFNFMAKFKHNDLNHRHVSARALSGPRSGETRASLAAGGCDAGGGLRLQWIPLEARKRPF